MINYEIERKFILGDIEIPLELYNCKIIEIEQHYITSKNNDIEVRIRKINDNEYYQTIKEGSGIKRSEIEIEISKEQYEELLKYSKSSIKKYRYELVYDGNTIYIDTYDCNLYGLNTVEVEFSTIEEGNKYSIPEWFGEEVTYNKEYKNKNLSYMKYEKGALYDFN